MTAPALDLGWGPAAGAPWPDPDTIVLLNRDLRPDADPKKFSRFRDDRWDLNAAIFEDHYRSISLNFALIPEPLRVATKHYMWQLLNHSKPWAPKSSRIVRISVTTINILFANQFQYIAQWLHSQGITAFCQVTDELLDTFLDAILDEDDPTTGTARTLLEVRRLWGHRDILPPSLRLPPAPPWAGEDLQDLLGGKERKPRENRTRRIGEPTMQMLLAWVIRFIEELSETILDARAEHAELYLRTPEGRRFIGAQDQGRHLPGQLQPKVLAYLEELRTDGRPLPGRRRPTGELQIRWRHVAAILDSSDSVKDTAAGRLIRDAGIPIGERAWLKAHFNGLKDGSPWRSQIAYEEAPELARLLSTACFIVITYLSGARAGETLNLRRGCVSFDHDAGLWLMEGLYYKGAVDEDGNKVSEGKIRPDPWVVVDLVARAVAILERLHPSTLLFPTRLEPFHKRWANEKRLGEARSDPSIGKDLNDFVAWVNRECTRLGRSDLIPDDGRGPLKTSRFRRTLAWFIRRRPRGLVAASIQYGHLHTRIQQGYAGSYESGFPDEYAFQEWLYRLECLAEDEAALAAGEHVSGPAAGAYRQRVTAANRQFAGHVLKNERQALDLLRNPLLQIHHGEGMTCVLNPATAACQLRGDVEDPLVTPDIDDCRPKCPNLARTDRDIGHIRRQADDLEQIAADTLAPSIRHHRERHELARLQAIVAAHETGTV